MSIPSKKKFLEKYIAAAGGSRGVGVHVHSHINVRCVTDRRNNREHREAFSFRFILSGDGYRKERQRMSRVERIWVVELLNNTEVMIVKSRCLLAMEWFGDEVEEIALGEGRRGQGHHVLEFGVCVFERSYNRVEKNENYKRGTTLIE